MDCFAVGNPRRGFPGAKHDFAVFFCRTIPLSGDYFFVRRDPTDFLPGLRYRKQGDEDEAGHLR